jgi:hypothetical protein
MLPLAAVLLLAAAPDPDGLIQKVLQAETREAPLRREYAMRETHTQHQLDKDGRIKSTSVDTYDNLFVEGELYRKLLLKDGKPLTEKQQAAVDADLAKTRAERRQRRRLGTFRRTISLSNLEDLPKQYELSIAGEETINGRKAWILVTKRKSKLPIEPKLWIDQEDFVIVRRQDRILEKHNSFEPGGQIEFQFLKAPDAWLLGAIDMRVTLSAAKFLKGRVHSIQKYTDHKRFDVQSTITLDNNP